MWDPASLRGFTVTGDWRYGCNVIVIEQTVIDQCLIVRAIERRVSGAACHGGRPFVTSALPVSYTHLTLPTKRIV